jgi:uncharacterized membrane protein SirB2
MKTEKTEQIANEIEAVATHLFIKGLKSTLILFSGLGVFLFIAIFFAFMGQFLLGFAINSILFVILGLTARKYQNKKAKGENK